MNGGHGRLYEECWDCEKAEKERRTEYEASADARMIELHARYEKLKETLRVIRDGDYNDGCGDHSCMLRRPKGMATNGGCRCEPREIRLAYTKARLLARTALEDEEKQPPDVRTPLAIVQRYLDSLKPLLHAVRRMAQEAEYSRRPSAGAIKEVVAEFKELKRDV